MQIEIFGMGYTKLMERVCNTRCLSSKLSKSRIWSNLLIDLTLQIIRTIYCVNTDNLSLYTLIWL